MATVFQTFLIVITHLLQWKHYLEYESVSIGLDHGLELYRWQAIIEINVEIVHMYTY